MTWNGPYPAIAVANFFLGKSALSPMKLEKLVFFAHGWRLAFNGIPLIDEPVIACTYGLRIESLHRDEFVVDGLITNRAACLQFRDGMLSFRPAELPDDNSLKILLNRIWEVYSSYTDVQLCNSTHLDNEPWTMVQKFYSTMGIPEGTIIPNELIRYCFERKLNESVEK